MKRLFSIIFVITAIFTTLVTAEDNLFKTFQNPPSHAKPFIRWWWGENSVAEKELLRQIDLFQKAGIGGFEINPISLPVKTELSSPSLEWLSPEFNRMVKIAVEEINKRGLIADLIVGSGWPFGAEFLQPGDMAKKLYVNTIEVNGPADFSKPVDELKISLRNSSYKWTQKPEFRFIYMAPADISDLSQAVDIENKIKDGKLTVKVPSGKHIIHVGLVQEGFSKVYNGSPGAKGPVLDHYKASALRGYLDRMSGKLGPALGGKLGPQVRAIFCDSIELSAANWTTDMPDVFKKQNGYDLIPYLPYIVDRKPITANDPWSSRLKRVRYDYCKTMVDMFQQRFIKVYHKWCHDNGCLSRYQAYGLPWLMGMLDSYLIPDIPETNNWVYSPLPTPDKHGFLVWTKYCSSAGHIKGRSIISSEAMTNTTDVFKTTLDRIKAADDMNFIMGVNHSVLHGYTYSPLSEGPHARIRYGAYFSEQNTWWPHFSNWTQYNARLSAVFQTAKPVVSLAIMGPRTDTWSQYGLERPPFHEKPWYLPQLWKVFSQSGSGADHVNEPVLQNASAENGKLTCGKISYDALIIAQAETIEPETAEKLLEFAKAGVKIVFIDKTPKRAPSLDDLPNGDRKVESTIEKVLSRKKNVFKIPAPEETGQWQKPLLTWADNLLDKIQIKRGIKLSKLDPAFYQTRAKHASRDIFFLVNTDSQRTLTFKARFDTENNMAWQWNPETGRKKPFANVSSAPIDIELPPHGSLLLVFDRDKRKYDIPAKAPEPSHIKFVKGPWNCKFAPADGEIFYNHSFELTDLGKSENKKLNTFAGVISYRKNIQIDELSKALQLDLGKVNGVSQVKLNGKSLGTRWYGEHIYDISSAAKEGENILNIKITTTLYNNLRTKSPETAAGLWANRRKSEPQTSGLTGPVKIKY